MNKTDAVNTSGDRRLVGTDDAAYHARSVADFIKGRFSVANIQTALRDASEGVRIGNDYVTMIRSSGARALSLNSDALSELLNVWFILLGRVDEADIRDSARKMERLADNLNTTTSELSSISESLRIFQQNWLWKPFCYDWTLFS